jgi:hypothetical protein
MKNWANALLVVMAGLATGCGEEVKHQEVLRGRWQLESRRLADGTELTPPQIAGVLEWFPLTESKAYATIVMSHGEEDVNFTGALYEFDGGNLVRDEYVRMGEGYTKTTWSQDAVPSRSEGTFESTEKSATLTHADGSRFVYLEKELTVTRSDGSVDRWTKDGDLKGMLAK